MLVKNSVPPVQTPRQLCKLWEVRRGEKMAFLHAYNYENINHDLISDLAEIQKLMYQFPAVSFPICVYVLASSKNL